MKKTLSGMGLVLVLSILGFVQTAAAFEQSAGRNRASNEPQRSHAADSYRSGSREDHTRREVRFQRAAHYERHLPAGYRTLRIANRILYYLNGIFYQSTPYGYEVVNAPMGSIVRELPFGYQRILYRGTVYYVYNNTYYVQEPMGYSVVTPPPQGVMFPAQGGW